MVLRVAGRRYITHAVTYAVHGAHGGQLRTHEQTDTRSSGFPTKCCAAFAAGATKHRSPALFTVSKHGLPAHRTACTPGAHTCFTHTPAPRAGCAGGQCRTGGTACVAASYRAFSATEESEGWDPEEGRVSAVTFGGGQAGIGQANKSIQEGQSTSKSRPAQQDSAAK